MPPRANVRFPSRPVLSHSKGIRSSRPWSQQLPVHVQRRGFADNRPIEDRPLEHKPSADGESKGPNMDQLPHVSEEAAATKKSMGEPGPDVTQGSTPAEVVKGDKEAQENLPKVMKEQMKKEQSGNGGKRSFSTYSRAQHRSSSGSPLLAATTASRNSKVQPFSTYSRMREELEQHQDQEANLQALHELAAQVSQEAEQKEAESAVIPGLKFEAPAAVLPPGGHLRKRYDTAVEQVTKLLMRHGKLSLAQTHMNTILSHLRTSQPPKPSERAQLVSNAPSLSTLPLDPIAYLTVAIDSIAPLFRMRSQKGIIGGGMSVQIPVPLRLRQRRRTAVMWILDQVEKRKGGVHPFPKRFADEVVAIVEGRSTLWERRSALHTLGTRSRANLSAMTRRR